MEIAAALLNFGGIGACAAVLYVLHTRHLTQVVLDRKESLKIFREELAAERAQCHEDHLRVIAAIGQLRIFMEGTKCADTDGSLR